jgi:chorismate mutase
VGLLTGLITLPLLPVRGTIAIAEQVLQQAEREFYDPARIRLQLEEVDRLRETGAISDDEADAIEDELVERLLVGRGRGTEEV